MKKTLLALAALGAFAGTAAAQSSVSVYGVVDLSLESVKGDSTITRVSSSNYATSRLGFKGTEDLGSGLKANFVLESGIAVDTGSNGNTRFFDRAAWAGLAGGFGELRLGRQDTSIGVLTAPTKILGAQAYDDFKIAGTFAGDTYRRADNAITYAIPKFVDGLSAEVQYSTGIGSSSTTGTEATNDIGEAWGLNVKYAIGGLNLGLGYIDVKIDAAGSATNTAAASADESDEGLLVYGGYNFGAFSLTAYYNQDDRSTADDKRKLYGIKAGTTWDKFYFSATLSKAEHVQFSSSSDAEATIIGLEGVYSLSKRTSLYALFTFIENDDGSRLGINSATALSAANAGKNTQGFAIGVSHAF